MRVVHVRQEPYTHYIGRGGKLGLGNPYVIGRDGTREQVVEMYRLLIDISPRMQEIIQALPEDAVLGCHCKPLACHGDAIVGAWAKMRGRAP